MDIKEIKKRFYEDLENKTDEERIEELENIEPTGLGDMLVRAWSDNYENDESDDS